MLGGGFWGEYSRVVFWGTVVQEHYFRGSISGECFGGGVFWGEYFGGEYLEESILGGTVLRGNISGGLCWGVSVSGGSILGFGYSLTHAFSTVSPFGLLLSQSHCSQYLHSQKGALFFLSLLSRMPLETFLVLHRILVACCLSFYLSYCYETFVTPPCSQSPCVMRWSLCTTAPF